MPPSDDEPYSRRQAGRFLNIIGIEDAKGNPQAIFVERSKEGEKGAVSRVNKKNEVVWEKRYENMKVNKITRVHIKKGGPYGTELHIHTASYVIQVPFSSDHTKRFASVCHNLDLGQPIYFEPYKMLNKDKKTGAVKTDKEGNPKYKSGWSIKQGGTAKEDKVPEALDTSAEGPVPAFKKLKNGKYDTSDHDEYIEDYLNKWIEKHGLDQTATSEDKDEDDDDEDNGHDTPDDDDDEDDAPPPPKKKSKPASDDMPV